VIPARISFVTIGAYDLEALRAFYADLGWKEALSAENFSAFETGGAVLGLFPIGNLIADITFDVEVPPRPPRFRGVTLAINVESADRVNEVLGDAKNAGATIVKDACDAEWGGRSGYFADPEGNVWEVAWMPGSSFDERGAMIVPKP
jgi:catechol 2,3-dioxygenase-like lactoylglutathione lyase family enzyme